MGLDVRAVPQLPDGFGERFRSGRYDLGDVTLHAVTGGDGPPLLLVGGWPQFWWQWRKIMPRLAEDYTVIAVDRAGSATRTSRRPATTASPRPATWPG